ncbi:MAG: DUF192 domain-containing protein [Chloroflexi bacterium]|nr:DUF192 domain-containing protein [Chloroflexota bacterium]
MRRPSRFEWLAVVCLLVTACGPMATGEPSPSSEPGGAVPVALQALPTTTIRLDEQPLHVAVADTPDARRRGLTGVGDLGSLDGLLFVYPAPTDTTFHMRGVPIPLDLAFFDAGGRWLATLPMAVCEAEPCPSYRAPGPFRWAVETEAGGLAGLGPGTTLSLAP